MSQTPLTFCLTTRRSARWEKSAAHFQEISLPVLRFYGPDGSVTGLTTLNCYEIDHPGSGYVMPPRQTGNFLAHYMVWQVCSFLAGDSFMVLEDDCRFRPDWRSNLQSALSVLPADWDMLLLGTCNCAHKPSDHLGANLYTVRYPHCTHAYMVRAKALPQLLERMQKVWAPIDLALAFDAYPHLRVYTVLPRLADQDGTVINP